MPSGESFFRGTKMMECCLYPILEQTPRFLDEYTMAISRNNFIEYNIPNMLENLTCMTSRLDACRCESQDDDPRDERFDDDMKSLCGQMTLTSIQDDPDGPELVVQDISIDGPTDSLETDPKTVYQQDSDGDTLLHIAIILSDVEKAVKFINIATTSSLLSIQNNLFQSPLHLAVLTNQHTIVRRLVVGGADMESRDKEGNTPVHLACRNGNSSVIDALLEPVSNDEKKQNTFEVTDKSIQQALEIFNYEGLPCLHEAAINRHMAVIRNLIGRGVDINSIDGKSGRTLLHKASADGNVELVKMLLSFPSCDINARAFDDYTPFDLARQRGHHAITYELAAEGSLRATSERLQV